MNLCIVYCELVPRKEFDLTCLQRGQMLIPGFIDLHLHAPQVRLPPHLQETSALQTRLPEGPQLSCSCGFLHPYV